MDQRENAASRAPVDGIVRRPRTETVSNERVELELDAILGGPWKRSLAEAKLAAMSLTREEAIKQAFRNGVAVGALAGSAAAWVLTLIF